jgi:hypothetical protein
MKLEIGKTYTQRDGQKAMVFNIKRDIAYTVTVNTKTTHCLFADSGRGNRTHNLNNHFDILPETQTREVWVNVYSHGTTANQSRKEANDNAASDRLACIPVTLTFTEGEGL